MSNGDDDESARVSRRVRVELRKRLQRSSLNRQDSDDLLGELAARLQEHLLGVRLSPERILAIGPGPESWFKTLRKDFAGAKVVAASPSGTQLASYRARLPWRRQPAVTLYPEKLPFTDQSFELVVANLLASEPGQMSAFIAEVARVLKPGSLFCASFLGPDTFSEFASAWANVDATPHVVPFMDMHDVGDLLAKNRFADIVVDAERLRLTYAEPALAIAEARRLGVGNIHPLRRRALTARTTWQQFLDSCERIEGRTPVTLECVYVHAWRSAPRSSIEVALA